MICDLIDGSNRIIQDGSVCQPPDLLIEKFQKIEGHVFFKQQKMVVGVLHSICTHHRILCISKPMREETSSAQCLLWLFSGACEGSLACSTCHVIFEVCRAGSYSDQQCWFLGFEFRHGFEASLMRMMLCTIGSIMINQRNLMMMKTICLTSHLG